MNITFYCERLVLAHCSQSHFPSFVVHDMTSDIFYSVRRYVCPFHFRHTTCHLLFPGHDSIGLINFYFLFFWFMCFSKLPGLNSANRCFIFFHSSQHKTTLGEAEIQSAVEAAAVIFKKVVLQRRQAAKKATDDGECRLFIFSTTRRIVSVMNFMRQPVSRDYKSLSTRHIAHRAHSTLGILITIVHKLLWTNKMKKKTRK